MIGYVALAGLLLGFGKAGIAGTLGPFVTLVLVLALPADDALGVALPMVIFADTFSVGAYWRQWEGKLLPRLVGAAVVGIAAGTAMITVISEEWLQRIIAVSLLAFAAAYVAGRRVNRPGRQGIWGIAVGATAGFTSTIAHAGGPPIVVYLMTAGLEPRRFVATSVAFFATINLIKVPGYLVAGLFDTELITSTLWGWITIPVGVLLGRSLIERIDRSRFESATVVLLAAGAVVLFVT